MRNITIKVIRDSKQRYETSGDYWIDKRGTIQVRISKSKNWRYEALLLIHELTEMFLCIDRSASLKAIHKRATRVADQRNNARFTGVLTPRNVNP